MLKQIQIEGVSSNIINELKITETLHLVSIAFGIYSIYHSCAQTHINIGQLDSDNEQEYIYFVGSATPSCYIHFHQVRYLIPLLYWLFRFKVEAWSLKKVTVRKWRNQLTHLVQHWRTTMWRVNISFKYVLNWMNRFSIWTRISVTSW